MMNTSPDWNNYKRHIDMSFTRLEVKYTLLNKVDLFTREAISDRMGLKTLATRGQVQKFLEENGTKALKVVQEAYVARLRLQRWGESKGTIKPAAKGKKRGPYGPRKPVTEEQVFITPLKAVMDKRTK